MAAPRNTGCNRAQHTQHRDREGVNLRLFNEPAKLRVDRVRPLGDAERSGSAAQIKIDDGEIAERTGKVNNQTLVATSIDQANNELAASSCPVVRSDTTVLAIQTEATSSETDHQPGADQGQSDGISFGARDAVQRPPTAAGHNRDKRDPRTDHEQPSRTMSRARKSDICCTDLHRHYHRGKSHKQRSYHQQHQSEAVRLKYWK